MRAINLPFLTLLVCCLTWSCRRVEDKVTDDELAMELLNGGHYHEASIVLKSQMTADPQNSAVRLRLASAFAGECGFNLIDAFAAFEPLINSPQQQAKSKVTSNDLDSSKAKVPLQSGPDQKPGSVTAADRQKIKAFERNILWSVMDSEVGLSIMYKLPYLDEPQRVQILSAIHLLSPVQPTDKNYRVTMIYRGVLHLLLFANVSRDAFSGIEEAADQNSRMLKVYCGLDIGKLLAALPDAVGNLKASLTEFTLAGSDSESRLFKNSYKLLQAVSDVQNFYLRYGLFLGLGESGNHIVKDEMCNAI